MLRQTSGSCFADGRKLEISVLQRHEVRGEFWCHLHTSFIDSTCASHSADNTRQDSRVRNRCAQSKVWRGGGGVDGARGRKGLGVGRERGREKEGRNNVLFYEGGGVDTMSFTSCPRP